MHMHTPGGVSRLTGDACQKPPAVKGHEHSPDGDGSQEAVVGHLALAHDVVKGALRAAA